MSGTDGPDHTASALDGSTHPLDGSARDHAASARRRRFRPLVRRRLAVLHAYVAGRATREEARRSAHLLAGSLGTYGWAEGSRLARRLDLALTGEQPVRLTSEEIAHAVERLEDEVGHDA